MASNNIMRVEERVASFMANSPLGLLCYHPSGKEGYLITELLTDQTGRLGSHMVSTDTVDGWASLSSSEDKCSSSLLIFSDTTAARGLGHLIAA